MARIQSLRGLLKFSRVRIAAQQAEIERLRAEIEQHKAFELQIATRLALAAEVLSIRAERSDRRKA